MLAIKTLAASAVFGLLTAGCVTLDDPNRPRGPMTYAAPVEEPWAQDARRQVVRFNLGTMLGVQGNETIETALLNFETRYRPDAKSRRNTIIGSLLWASDRNCDIYMENLRGTQSLWRTGTDLLSLGLGTVGGVLTDEGSTRWFNGLATGADGLGSALDKGFMGGNGADIILAGVRMEREPMRREIIIRMGEDYDAWPVALAIGDAMRYHGRCNVVTGLRAAQRIVNQAEATISGAASGGQPNTPQGTGSQGGSVQGIGPTAPAAPVANTLTVIPRGRL